MKRVHLLSLLLAGAVLLACRAEDRAATRPVLDEPGGASIVELGVPDASDATARRQYFAREFWVNSDAHQTTFRIRFDRPLVAPDLRADLPTPAGATAFGGEISLQFLLDADGNAATGTRMDSVYAAAGGRWASEAAFHRGFGIDRMLAVEGKKNVIPGGEKAWALHVEMKTHRARAERAGDDWAILIDGDSLVRKVQGDAGLDVNGDVLTLSMPTTAAGVTAGGKYRVYLPSNSTVTTSAMKVIHTGKVGPS